MPPAIPGSCRSVKRRSAGPIRVRSFGFCTGERMPAERMLMRRVREVLRLRTAGVGLNEIARRVGVAPSTVRLTLKRLASAGFSWPLPAEMTDSALEAALFAAVGTKQGHRRHDVRATVGRDRAARGAGRLPSNRRDLAEGRRRPALCRPRQFPPDRACDPPSGRANGWDRQHDHRRRARTPSWAALRLSRRHRRLALLVALAARRPVGKVWPWLRAPVDAGAERIFQTAV